MIIVFVTFLQLSLRLMKMSSTLSAMLGTIGKLLRKISELYQLMKKGKCQQKNVSFFLKYFKITQFFQFLKYLIINLSEPKKNFF